MKIYRLFGRLMRIGLILIVSQVIFGCSSKSKPPKPPFSMNALARLYVNAKAIQSSSLPDSVKEAGLRVLYKKHKISRDSLKQILIYFKKNPEVWESFYKKVETFSKTQGHRK
ncbi:hypothetical protein BMS3Abin05_01395 [bacterium BMS3Abin05]|nr:hypothetical protein BMS3Abin05_01395 [bacterium BMS3Abin05]GBE26274.1 hypothetical protein BMS3Bbin03_00186 [bacterium BMS3Bbin03]HDK36294.1 hypothetical protein [Bacteroidota bacterium]HDL78438.1 hypothetical protein [Bacteroidota bacterium]HDZ12299.1 hypothetical protein [Bacteroidota bacterium]